jgi:hypothetical protein
MKCGASGILALNAKTQTSLQRVTFAVIAGVSLNGLKKKK